MRWTYTTKTGDIDERDFDNVVDSREEAIAALNGNGGCIAEIGGDYDDYPIDVDSIFARAQEHGYDKDGEARCVISLDALGNLDFRLMRKLWNVFNEYLTERGIYSAFYGVKSIEKIDGGAM